MTDTDAQRRAANARRLLDDPLLNEVFTGLEYQAIESLLTVDGAEPEDDRKRRALVDRVKAIRGVRRALQSAVSDGVRVADPQSWA